MSTHNSRRVVILNNTIRRGTGGFASILEMAQVFTRIPNVTVQFVVLRMDLQFKRHLMEIRQDPLNEMIGFLYAPGYRSEMLIKGAGKSRSQIIFRLLVQVLRKLSKSSIREILEYVVWFWRSEESARVTTALNQADILIKAMSLTGKELTFIRQNSSASLIQNHAGSPETYENYWLSDEHIIEEIDPSLSMYVRFCLAFDKILFQSTAQAEECGNRHPVLAARVITLHPTCNELDVANYLNSDSPFGVDEIAIVNVGVLSPRKAQMDSIDAFCQIAEVYPNAVLYFLGNTDMWKAYYKELIARVKVLDLDARVQFLGHRRDYLKYMAHANCIIQTSHGEGVSRVLREAMFLKVPIVSYAISGTADLLEGDTDALLVESGNIKVFSEALETLLSDSQLREMLAENAHARYQMKHSNDVYVRNLEQLLSKVGDPQERT